MQQTATQSRFDDAWGAILDTARAEARRLAALDSLDLLDTPAETELKALVAEAAATFAAPIAAICLIDADRQWVKAAVGLSLREIPRACSFCDKAIRDPHVMVVADATRDPYFAGNPLVTGAPDIRFYAGAPLIDADGLPLGALCVIDHKARAAFGPQDRDTLAALAGRVLKAMTRHGQGGEGPA